MANVFGEAMVEIVVENETNLKQWVSADVAMSKLAAQVLPRAAHLLGEPGNAPLLTFKLCVDEVPDMWCFVRNNGVNPFSCRLYYP